MINCFLFFLVMEHRWNEIDWGKPKYSGKNLSQRHFVRHKSHMGCGWSVTIVTAEAQQCILCDVEPHITLNYIKILVIAQQCFCGKFMSPATIKHT
jgi:hypothetical protein